MSWGVEKARELGIEIFVKGSEVGRYLYSQLGLPVFMKFAFTASKADPCEDWVKYEHGLTANAWHAMKLPVSGAFEDDTKQKIPWELRAQSMNSS